MNLVGPMPKVPTFPTPWSVGGQGMGGTEILAYNTVKVGVVDDDVAQIVVEAINEKYGSKLPGTVRWYIRDYQCLDPDVYRVEGDVVLVQQGSDSPPETTQPGGWDREITVDEVPDWYFEHSR